MDEEVCVCAHARNVCLIRLLVCLFISVVGAPEGAHGTSVSRAEAEKEEPGETQRGSERDGERPHEETTTEVQLGVSDTVCESHTLREAS